MIKKTECGYLIMIDDVNMVIDNKNKEAQSTENINNEEKRGREEKETQKHCRKEKEYRKTIIMFSMKELNIVLKHLEKEKSRIRSNKILHLIEAIGKNP